MSETNFILFCLARTGSTSLAEALQRHPKIRCLREPFNSRGAALEQPFQVTDRASLQSSVAGIYERFNGIKHVWDPYGWPFENDPTLNGQLACLPNQKVIFLNRRNMLKRIVSLRMSLQHHAWSKQEADAKETAAFTYEPLSIDSIHDALGVEQEAIGRCAALAAANKSSMMMLWYEDLFPEVNGSGKVALASIAKVLQFLDVPKPGPLTRMRMLRFLTSRSRMNSTETYARIPNIREVEEECGSALTGWLFGEPKNEPISVPVPGPRVERDGASRYFLIYSLGRSGSTNLSKALNVHPQIRCCLEPFNPHFPDADFCTRATDERGLQDCLRDIRQRYNGIKHVWTYGGWPFKDPTLNTALATKTGHRLILLSRRNVLKRMVSQQMSEQMAFWNVTHPGEQQRIFDHSFQPLDTGRIAFELRRQRQTLLQYERMEKQNLEGTLRLYFEDLYPESDPSGTAGLSAAYQAIEFLGFEKPDRQTVDTMSPYLNVTRRMNSEETYRRVPGINQIEEAFGSDESGWLFR